MTTATQRTADDYQVHNGTYYHKDTPRQVIDILEHARQAEPRQRLRLHYGSTDAEALDVGRDWHECNDVTGTIGRSTGKIKVPLLIKTSRSLGGGAILDHRIVRIRDTKTGRDIYRHPSYHTGEVDLEYLFDGSRQPWVIKIDGKACLAAGEEFHIRRVAKELGLIISNT